MARIGGVEDVAVDNLGGHKAFLLIVDVLDWTCRLSFWKAPTLPLAAVRENQVQVPPVQRR
jgi:hypothetical protein